MWSALLDKFQCCFNPKDEKLNSANKEVCLDNLEQKENKRPGLMKKKTIVNHRENVDIDTDESLLNKVKDSEYEKKNNSSHDESKNASKLGYSKTLKKKSSDKQVSNTRKDLLNIAFGNN